MHEKTAVEWVKQERDSFSAADIVIGVPVESPLCRRNLSLLMEKLRQKEKQEWTDRNSMGRSPDLPLLPHPPTGNSSYDCWDLRRSQIQHCWYSFYSDPGISFR